MSILAHVIFKGGLKGEPTATQGLAYVLNQNREVAQALIGLLPKEVEFDHGRIAAEIKSGEDSTPDLSIYDLDGRLRVLVENKFWAGLSYHQPVSYLEGLPEDCSSALLFVVPRSRVPAIWKELKKRCEDARHLVGDEHRTEGLIWSKAGGRVLGITSWSHALNLLQRKAKDSTDESADLLLQDIRQLRMLVEQITGSQAFLPIRPEELTDQYLPRRMNAYHEIVKEVAGMVKHELNEGNVGSSSSGSGYSGFYLRLHNRYYLWFGIDLSLWWAGGNTPVWMYPWASARPADWSQGQPEWETVRRRVMVESGVRVS